jgi:hypothetical protein
MNDTVEFNVSEVYAASQPFWVTVLFDNSELFEKSRRWANSVEFGETLLFNFSGRLNESDPGNISGALLSTLVYTESRVKLTADQRGPSANGLASAQFTDSSGFFPSVRFNQSSRFESHLGRSESFAASLRLRASERLAATRGVVASVGPGPDGFIESANHISGTSQLAKSAEISRSDVIRGFGNSGGGWNDAPGSSGLGGLGLAPVIGIALGALAAVAAIVVILLIRRKKKGSSLDFSGQEDGELNIESHASGSWEGDIMEAFGNTGLNALTTFAQHESLWATDTGSTFRDDPFENAGFVSFAVH